MATDYNILEDKLKQKVVMLKRELHMRKVRDLARKHGNLSTVIMQRRRINYLEEQVDDLIPTVSLQYSPEFRIKDNEIKGYLVYLLKMKDYFAREVATKKEIIQQRESQIKTMIVKLCGLNNEYAKRQKRCLPKPMEYAKLENTSLKKNQIEKRISTLRNENRKMKDDMKDMRIFHGQYKKLEKEIRNKTRSMNDTSKALLEKAVANYEEKEEIINKMKTLQERCSQDVRKAEVKQHALNVCIEKSQKNEEFLKLQNKSRVDARVTRTKEMMDKGLTGLEPKVENLQQLHETIADAAGEETPKKMGETFMVSEDEKYSKFDYLDQLLKQMNHVGEVLEDLRGKNTALLKRMSTSERRLRWEIEEKQEEAGEKEAEADLSEAAKAEAREGLDSCLALVKSLHQKTFPDDTSSSDEVDDRNAMDLLEDIEKSILEQLMLLEYKRTIEASDEDFPPAVSETDEPNIDEPEIVDSIELIHPRLLKSETELSILNDLKRRTSVLGLEELKQKAVDVLSELGSDESREEDVQEDSATSDK